MATKFSDVDPNRDLRALIFSDIDYFNKYFENSEIYDNFIKTYSSKKADGLNGEYILARCYEFIFINYDFRDEFNPTAIEMRRRINGMLDLWENKCKMKRFKEIPFDLFIENIAPYDSSAKFEDVMGVSPKKVIKAGFRPIDIHLYSAVKKLNFKDVKTLLSRGADPYELMFPFDDNELMMCAFDEIEDECYFCEEDFMPAIKKYIENPDSGDLNALSHMTDVIYWAANMQMHELLRNGRNEYLSKH